MFKLLRKGSGEEVLVGAELYDHSDTSSVETWVITGWREPQHSGSSGHIFVRPKGPNMDEFDDREFFPHVFGLEIVEVAQDGILFRVDIIGGPNVAPSLTVYPIEYPRVTLDKLKAAEWGHRFHRNICRRNFGPRGGVEQSIAEHRVTGMLKTWKTRPTEFRVPTKYGLKGYGEVTHRNAGDFHLASECPLALLPTDRDEMVALLKSFNIFGAGRHDFRFRPQVTEVAHAE